MARILSVSAIVALASLASTAFAGAAEQDSSSSNVLPLREAFKGKLLIGTALDVRQRGSPLDISIATTHYNAITPENSMKPMALQPSEGRFNFAGADRLVEMAEKSGATPIGHCLVWHSQTPRWFFQGLNGQPAGRVLALARLRKHITAVVGHYKGRVKQWDVVNEAISDGPGQLLRQSPWLREVGEDYLAEAFRTAHDADPDAMLIYNDYGIELHGKREKALQLLRKLIEQKVPIHAVGIQAHWRLDGPDFAEVEESIKQFAALGLKVMITELDISVLPTAYRRRGHLEKGRHDGGTTLGDESVHRGITRGRGTTACRALPAGICDVPAPQGIHRTRYFLGHS